MTDFADEISKIGVMSNTETVNRIISKNTVFNNAKFLSAFIDSQIISD